MQDRNDKQAAAAVNDGRQQPFDRTPRQTGAGANPLIETPSDDDLFYVARLLTMGELSASFLHDIANPLMLIRGHIGFMNERVPADDPLRQNLEVVDRAARRIEDMSRRLLDFSKKRGRFLPPSSCSIAEIVEDALRFVQPYLLDQTITTSIKIADGLPSLGVNRWKLSQAIINLLQNAADAMSGCERRILTVSAACDQQVLRISVADTGRGIPDEHLHQMFVPFFTTKPETGTGMGLYITSRIVDELEGEIAVQTSPSGTTFTITVPLHQ